MTTSLRNVLVMGGGGQLSQAMSHHDDCANFNMVFLNKTQCDITNSTAVQHAILHHQPHVIINTAAYTKVDLAETETDAAMQVNLAGVMNLAKLSHEYKIPLIHLSTDYVFSGDSHSPYSEEDSVNPINFYGQSKLAGEIAVREYHDQHIILRVSGIFSEFSHNFFNTMTRLFFEKESLRVVSDQFTCPTSAHDIAACLFKILHSEKKIWHLSLRKCCALFVA